MNKFPFTVTDANGNVIYYEDADGWSYKREFDDDNNEVYYEDSTGYKFKSKD